MLVVNGVKLIFFNQPQEVREFESGRSARLEQPGKTGNEAVYVRHMGKDVVCRDKVRLPSPLRKTLRERNAEKLLDNVYSFAPCSNRGACRRFNAVTGDAAFLDIL